MGCGRELSLSTALIEVYSTVGGFDVAHGPANITKQSLPAVRNGNVCFVASITQMLVSGDLPDKTGYLGRCSPPQPAALVPVLVDRLSGSSLCYMAPGR